jgi:hypothetical protein
MFISVWLVKKSNPSAVLVWHCTGVEFHQAMYDQRLKFGIMNLRLALNLLHFFPDLGALYALNIHPTFIKSTLDGRKVFLVFILRLQSS